MRSEFEKLPLVAEILNDADIFYSEGSCLYENKLYNTFTPEEITFLNGAWYAWKEALEFIKSELLK